MKKNILKIKFFAPLVIFFLIAVVLWKGLFLQPEKISTPLINERTPKFFLPILQNQNKFVSEKIFTNKITLLNIWSSNCIACLKEHKILMQLATKKNINLIGMIYHDNPNRAKAWLQQFGNPYKIVIVDQTNNNAINWGIYGTPETFIIDKNNIIRYKLIGAINKENWGNILKPIIAKLQNK